MMRLHVAGKRVRAICRECGQLHAAKDCPRYAAARENGLYLLEAVRQAKEILKTRREVKYGS